MSARLGPIVLLLLLILISAAGSSNAQTGKSRVLASQPQGADLSPIRSSPAYAELLLHKTELEADLASLLEDYKEDFPKVAEIRRELVFVNAEIARLFNVKPGESGKLTPALGQLMLKKIGLETQLEALKARYKDDHPDVKRLKKQVDIYEAAIKDILG